MRIISLFLGRESTEIGLYKLNIWIMGHRLPKLEFSFLEKSMLRIVTHEAHQDWQAPQAEVRRSFVIDPGKRMDDLRFMSLWNRCALNPKTCDPAAVFELVYDHYAESHRYYHTPEHIRHCLRQFDAVSGALEDPDAIEMSLWFHDVIYDPRARDNERKSAELFVERARNCFDVAFCEKVFRLILVTTHKSLPVALDEQYMVDIDLSSFGQPWIDFKRDSDAVRKEYSHMSDKAFFDGQVRFLQSLLDRPNFYATGYFRDNFEHSARRNITRYLRLLKSQGFG
jgi:predicted metal-dependent HD superfamily phosphohydrolase